MHILTLRYPGQTLEAQAGELYPDVLSYGPDDWAALSAWCVSRHIYIDR
jgi:hypothetical protein